MSAQHPYHLFEIRECMLRTMVSISFFLGCFVIFCRLFCQVDVLMKEWRQFKSQVPTYGCIILDTSCKFCLLVHGFSSSNSWSFPKGKVNEGETPQQCALREVSFFVGRAAKWFLEKAKVVFARFLVACHLEVTFFTFAV